MEMINENILLGMLKGYKNVLLIEPPYKRQYIPIGLGRISSFIKKHGGKTTFSRGAIPNKPGKKFDLICMASVFTTDIKIVKQTIKECQQSLFLRGLPIILGGIAASLMPEQFKNYKNFFLFSGVSDILDLETPDYSLPYEVNETWNDFSTVFTTRGCHNKCGFCMVHKLEPEYKIIPTWKDQIVDYKNRVKISDNNLLSTDHNHVSEVFDYLKFVDKPVLFNNGLYAKNMNKENAKQIAALKYTRFGLRTAFDRINEEKDFRTGMELLLSAGANLKKDSLAYVLFNYMDTPQEAYYRVKTCWEYGVHPYAMRYRPLDALEKSNFIGKYWTKNLVSAFKNYVELYGYNRLDTTFETWCKSDKKIRLTPEDWQAWDFKK